MFLLTASFTGPTGADNRLPLSLSSTRSDANAWRQSATLAMYLDRSRPAVSSMTRARLPCVSSLHPAPTRCRSRARGCRSEAPADRGTNSVMAANSSGDTTPLMDAQLPRDCARMFPGSQPNALLGETAAARLTQRLARSSSNLAGAALTSVTFECSFAVAVYMSLHCSAQHASAARDMAPCAASAVASPPPATVATSVSKPAANPSRHGASFLSDSDPLLGEVTEVGGASLDTHATTTSAHRSAAALATLARASAAPALSAKTQSASEAISKTDDIRSRLNRIRDLPDLASETGNSAAISRSRASSTSAATASARIDASGRVGCTARPTAAAARTDRLHPDPSPSSPNPQTVIARIAASTPSFAPFVYPRSARPTDSAGIAASMISTAAPGSKGCRDGDIGRRSAPPPETAGNQPTGDGNPSVDLPSRSGRRSLPLATASATSRPSSLAIPRSVAGYSPSFLVPAAAAKAALNAPTAPERSPE